MSLSKSLRVRVIGMVSLVILFAQITIAAYACPAMTGGAGPDKMVMAGMPCAGMMAADVPLDPGQPMLCMQHCQFGSTSQVVDNVSPVFVSVTALPAVFTVRVDEGLHTAPGPWVVGECLLDRPPPLAHSVEHCCYRI